MSLTEYIAYCVTCANDSGYVGTAEDASEWLDENHPEEMGCADTGITEGGITLALDGITCGEFTAGDWIGSSTDETVIKIDHFEFYAGFGFMGVNEDGTAVYLDTAAQVEPADDDPS